MEIFSIAIESNVLYWFLQVLADGIEKYGLLIGKLENQLELLNGFKAKVEHEKGVLQGLGC